ncbi:MAG: CHAD domain-containing protein [Magnetococcus sp. MYC-9]
MALPLIKMIRLDLSAVPLPAGVGALLNNHPLVRTAAGAVHLQERNEIHYDTPTLQLYRQEVALTLNRRGEQWVQRCGMAEGPGHEKKWVETPVPDQQLDMRTLRKLPTCPALNGADARTLAPVFTLHCREQQWVLSLPGGVSILLREERGYIKLGVSRQSFHELVFEHQAGHTGRWFQTALTVAYTLFLSDKGLQEKAGAAEKGGPGLLSLTPATRGFAWLDPALLMPVPSATSSEGKGDGSAEEGVADLPLLKLNGEMTCQQAFVSLCAALLQRMQLHQSTVLYGGKQSKLEGVRLLYQMAGRLQILVELYRDLLPREIVAEQEQEIAWLLKELLLVQECQTLLRETLEPLIEQFATHSGLEELLLKGKNGLLLAIKRLEKSLASFRYTRLVLGMEQWITGNQWEFLSDPAQREGLDMPVAQLVTDCLQRYQAQLRKQGRQWPEMDLATRSALRDEIDRMSHATDLFTELFINKRLKQTGARSSFQESLGKVQAALHLLVHVQGCSRFLSRRVGKEDNAAPSIQEWQEGRIQRALTLATREWDLFSNKLSFWM